MADHLGQAPGVGHDASLADITGSLGGDAEQIRQLIGAVQLLGQGVEAIDELIDDLA